MQVMKSDWTLRYVPKPLKVATTKKEFKKVWGLREAEYSKLYPGVTHFKNDRFDHNACVLYSQNQKGEVVSTGRIAFDGPGGLPADELIKPEINKLRKKGLVVAESSKFTINPKAKGILPYYFYSYYEIAAKRNIDSMIFIIPDKNVRLYQKTAGAKILLKDIGYSYGTDAKFSLLECRVKEIIPTFLQYWGRK